mgnify:CR=1 FL=1
MPPVCTQEIRQFVKVDMKNKVMIIAEAGVNHNGSMELARKLVDAAAEAGVDMVKFQTFKAEKLVTIDAEQAEYQQKNTGKSESQYAMLKRLELSEHDHEELIAYCQQKGIRFFSTAFDMESLDYLRSLNLGIWKIPSGEITNYPYLKKIASYGEPVILSSGMCSMDDIQAALDVLTSSGLSKDDIALLHCNTEYPTPWDDVNLKAMPALGEHFGVKFGYSDHTVGIEVPIAATALGATIIEKHFTLDKTLPGPDHRASLEPDELAAMVKAIRHIEQALGSSQKDVTPSEQKNMQVARKSIVAAKDICRGDILLEDCLAVMRPGTGISPMLWNEVVGSVATRDYKKGECIER